MADNFDLRQFLTENKLTKNTQLLSEGSDYGYEDLMDVVDVEYDGDPAIAAAVEDAFHNGDIDTSEFGHDLSAPSKAVAQIANGMDIEATQQSMDFEEGVEEAAPSAGMTHKEKSALATKARHGGDIGHKGAGFAKVEKAAEKQYGSKEAGQKVAAAAMWKNAAKHEEVEEGIHDRNILSRPLSNPAIEPLDRSPEELGKDADSRSESILKATYRNQINDPNISDEELRYILSGKGKKGMGGTPNAVNNILASRSTMKEGKSYKVSKNSKEAQHLKKGDIIGSGDEVVSVSAGAKTPAGKVEVTLKTKDGKTKLSIWGKTTKIGVKPKETEKETVKENTMTERDKYLTRLVENALGLTNNDEDQEFDPGHDIEQAQHNIERQYEGNEMADETVIPEYHSIDELMKEIDLGTNDVAEKHKISKMKAIAEALRAKVKSLEEGEHAAHIDQKAVKQMGKDIAALEKTAAKLQAAYDKKFNKKEKAAPKKEKEAVALAEGFDLRKFLVENRLTASSKAVNEYGGYGESLIGVVDEHIGNLEGTIDPEEIILELEELQTYCTTKIEELRAEE